MIRFGDRIVARLYQVEGKIPENFEPVDEFFCRNRVTPLLPVSDIQRAARLGAIQSGHVGASGGRKDR